MGQLYLVLLLVAVICGGLPLLIFAYMRGSLKIPRGLLTLLAFGGISIIAILQFPLKLFNGNPVSDLAALVIYFFIGQFLRKEYTKSKWRFCMGFTFLANCMGILIQYLILKFGMVYYESNRLTDVVVFLVVVQAVICLTYFLTPDKELKKTKKREKK